MTRTYSQIVKQIKVLEQEAEKARRKEVDGVVGRIRDAIEAYGLTAQDLGFGGAAPKPAAKAGTGTGKRRGRPPGSAAKKAVRVVKFANGSGGTWGGLGKRPQWLRDALEQGKSLADFAV